ncbi:adenosine deaminase [Dermabacteraceae bacterium P13264]
MSINGAQRDLRALPKAHLHLHFTGSLKPASLAEMGKERGIRVPASLVDDKAFSAEATSRGWFRFQRQYDAARKVVRDEAAMRRVVREAVADDAAEGSCRLEIQVDPTSYAPFVGGITPALEIVLDAAAQAERETGVSVGVIVAASRIRHPLEARTLARLAARYSDRVVGFGLSNDERRGATSEFGAAFRIARNAGIPAVPHGGELLGPEHVREVMRELAPRRLGHGVRASEDPRLLDELVAAGLAFEVCPASNVSLGVYPDLSRVPVDTLLAHGAQVALGADDPLLFGSRLLAQYESLRRLGYDDSRLAALAEGSVRASFASDTQKREWLADIARWLAADPQQA